jgi:hypothetical protein
VTYPDGHFTAVFPAEPEQQSTPGELGPAKFIVYVASVRNQALAAAEDFTPHLSEAQYDQTLRSGVSSFISSAGVTKKSENATTFRSHPGRHAVVTAPDGGTFELVVFMYEGKRLYILFGRTGEVYDTLTDSFEILPD